MKIERIDGEFYIRFRVDTDEMPIFFAFAGHENGGDLWLVRLPNVGFPMDW